MAKDDKEVASALMDLVKDPSRNIRRTAWFALAQNGVKSALPALEAQLKNEPTNDQPTLEAAIATLKRRTSSTASSSRSTAPTPSPSSATDNKTESADIERQAAELELQAKELRNKAEALKLKDERAKLGTTKAAN